MAIFEIFSVNFAYRILKDVGRHGLRKWKGMPAEKKIELRQKWKPMFEVHIKDRHSNGLRSDTIIRDVKRVDYYPDGDEKLSGISPWFPVGLVGVYHRGIYVALQWHRLVETAEGKFRFLDILEHDKNDKEVEQKSIKVIQLGSIPFENIEDVDFEGDEYYGYPHIFCHFSIKGQPYEKMAFYTEHRLPQDSLPYYSEVIDFESVRKKSIK